LGYRKKIMPLTELQRAIALLLAKNRTHDSYLAGGAALHFEPNSKRYSNDLDYFHDSVERVASAFDADRTTLEGAGFTLAIQMNQPGFIRAIVSKDGDSTKVEWAHDSAWRFMPAIHNSETGMQLDPIDLAVNKVLALAGRDEPRDFLDILYIHEMMLPLGALIWAAVGKDPGFTPLSMLDIIRRRGKYRPEDFARLHLVHPVDLVANKNLWLAALDEAEQFIKTRPPSEVGALYYSKSRQKFIMPAVEDDVALHYGSPGGVLPKFL
jgi:hypothetical protein